MYQIILMIHVLTAVFLVALVLLQQGKGAAVGAAFGSGASQTVFGSRGSGSFLFRLTAAFVSIFFITSISLNYIVAKAYKQEKVMTYPVQKPLNINLPKAPIGNNVTKDNTHTETNIGRETTLPNKIPVRK